MDIINENVEHPQKVEVVNPVSASIVASDSNPLLVTFPDSLQTNQTLKVTDTGSGSNNVLIKPQGSNINGFISCIHVVNNNIGYVFPINQAVYNVDTTSFTSAVIPSIHASFEQKFPSATSIIVFYSYQTSSRIYYFDSYNGES